MGVGCPCLNPGPTSSLLMLMMIRRRVWTTTTTLPQYRSFQHMCDHPKHRSAHTRLCPTREQREAVRTCPVCFEARRDDGVPTRILRVCTPLAVDDIFSL